MKTATKDDLGTRIKVKLACFDVMGVPSTRATCSACGKVQEFFGVRTYRRAEEWAKQHECGVEVVVPRAGFEMPPDPEE